MKLQVLQENLSRVLSLSSRFVNQRAQLPVLGNVKLEAKKTKLLIQATNLEMSISTSIGAKVQKEGEIAVPAKTFSDLISSLRSGTLDIVAEKEKVEITSNGFSGSLLAMQTADFPSIPQGIGKGAISLPREELTRALSQTLFASSVDETRPVLTGVLFVFNKKSLTLVATDGFRLSQKKISLGSSVGSRTIILPKNSLSELVRLPEGKNKEISLLVKKSDNQVIFGIGEAILTSRVIDGEFPNFEAIIPKDSKVVAKVDKQELVGAVKAASVYARDAANIVKLKVGKSNITISSQSSKSGEGEIKVDAKVEPNTDPKLEISYNFRFIEEFLNSMGGEEVSLEFTDTKSPGIFRDVSEKDYLHIIMPVRV